MILSTNFLMSIWDLWSIILNSIVLGYYFMLFFYFFLMRFRTSKKIYWLYFSLLFIFFACARGFWLAYYFFIPGLEGSISNAEIVAYLMFTYRFATFFTWLGISCVTGVLGVLLFPPLGKLEQSTFEKGDKLDDIKNFLKSENVRTILRIFLLVLPIIVGILSLTLSDSLLMDPEIVTKYNVNIELETIFNYPIGRAIINIVLLPLLVFLIPFVFLYLAWKTFGVLRKSYALNAIGFLLYFLGRILQGIFDTTGHPHFEATIPPLIIILSLLIIVIANNYEQLK